MTREQIEQWRVAIKKTYGELVPFAIDGPLSIDGEIDKLCDLALKGLPPKWDSRKDAHDDIFSTDRGGRL